jgi:cytochrome c oxidase assembly protein Cox11
LTTTTTSDGITERTEVLTSEQNVVNAALQFVSNTKSEIDVSIDYSRPHLAIEIEELKKAFFDAKNQIFEAKK